jgi:glycosyltransferase involved in cell wall biosynthesis
LSILVPLYNEEEYIGYLLEAVARAPLPTNMDREIIIVDDCSTDGSLAAVDEFVATHADVPIRVIPKSRNEGKGSAIRSAIEHATGDYAVVQDADLEYDPREYGKLLAPLVAGRADAVYGSRFVVSGERRVLYFWHSLANRLLTLACNMLADLNLTDMETCYKMVRTDLLKSIPLRCNRFGFEPEITMKLAKRHARIYETAISYHGRTYAEGKKIGLGDAFAAIFTVLRFWISNDIYKESGRAILDAFSDSRRFNRWMADTIRPYLGAEVLEIGAGMGNLTSELAPRRKRYVATDIDMEHLQRLRNQLQFRTNLDVCYCDLSHPADFESFSGKMDTVICLNVLEHIENDNAALKNLYASLKPGGRAIVLVPEGQRLFCGLDEVLGHYRRYSEKQLRERMEEVGFRVEKILHFNRISRPAWFVSGKILHRKTITSLQMRTFDRFVWLWRRIDPWLPWKPTSIIGVGVK